VGPTRIGKTSWARSLGHHMFMSGLFNLDEWDESARYLVIDDIDWKWLPAKKQLLGGQSNFNLSDKYRRKRQVVFGLPTIYCMNYDNYEEIAKDPMLPWLNDNCLRCFVENPFF